MGSPDPTPESPPDHTPAESRTNARPADRRPPTPDRLPLSRRAALAVAVGLGGLGLLSGPAQGSHRGPHWRNDVDAGGNDLLNVGALSTAANPTAITDFAGDNLAIDDGVLHASAPSPSTASVVSAQTSFFEIEDPSDTRFVVPFDTVSIDRLDEFDPSENRFTPEEAGIYRFDVMLDSLQIRRLTSGGSGLVILWVETPDEVRHGRLTAFHTFSTEFPDDFLSSYNPIYLHTLIELDAGEAVQIKLATQTPPLLVQFLGTELSITGVA